MLPKDKILDTLKKSERALKNGEIADLCGLDKNIVEKTMKELKAEDKIFSPLRCFWQAK